MLWCALPCPAPLVNHHMYNMSSPFFAASAASEQHPTLEPLPGFPPRRRPRYERQGREGATSGSGGLGAGPHEEIAPSIISRCRDVF